MIRRLNFTGRRRIARSDVTVTLDEAEADRFRVTVSLRLEKYELPPSARVFVEAYRQTTWQRFDFGDVSAPAPVAPPILRGFGSAQGVRFRLRVVEAVPAEAAANHAPRLLALADSLRPVREPGKKGGRSLLPVDWGELKHHTWKLEIDDESGPLLRVSRSLVPDREAFVGSKEFISLALPFILRQILERALLRSGDGDDDAGEGWAAEWLRLARTWSGPIAPPGRDGREGLTDDEEDWLDAVVEEFARDRDLARKFTAWWTAEPS